MKTLDEVIEIFEKVTTDPVVWYDKKTALMKIETLTSALQYLKKYQHLQEQVRRTFVEEYGKDAGKLE